MEISSISDLTCASSSRYVAITFRTIASAAPLPFGGDRPAPHRAPRRRGRARGGRRRLPRPFCPPAAAPGRRRPRPRRSSARVGPRSRSRSASVRIREARDLAHGAALYQRGDTAAAASRVRAPRLARGEGRRRLRGVAERLARPARAAREAVSRTPRSSSSTSDSLGCGRTKAIPSRPGARSSTRPRTRRTRSWPGTCCIPDLPRGLPAFIPSFSAPSSVTRLPPQRAARGVARGGRGGRSARAPPLRHRAPARGKARVGVARLRRGGEARSRTTSRRASRPPSASSTRMRRRSALRSARARSRARIRMRPTVRFHLGVLLLWTGRIDEAKRQFRLASRTQPGSPLAREADRYLETIRRARG